MTNVRPLHLHTSESVCIDLIAGQAITVENGQQAFTLNSEAARAVLAWYLTNRTKWAGNVSTQDAEAIVDAAQTKPPAPAPAQSPASQKKRFLTLAKIEAHRFGGLHAFSDGGKAPENFTCEPTKPITLLEGWNGSGKTSILNAVIWCLTGHLLRPQRKPEETEEEFTCRIKIDESKAPTEHTLTPVSPLPDTRFPPDLAKGQIHLDTWVELTFLDEDGEALKPIRRTQRRRPRGGVEEVKADIASLGIDPIAARIGTTIPGILPFIQIGTVSEFGQAIAQLTGLSELVNLAKHAKRTQERIDKEFKKQRNEEIFQQNEKFAHARADLLAIITETPSLKPADALPNPEDGGDLEASLTSIEAHFSVQKSTALASAKLILGDAFDPLKKEDRDSLESNVSPALLQLSDFGKLSSSARLTGLSKISLEQISDIEKEIAKIHEEANTLAELKNTPDLMSRRRLYARVASWMKESGDIDLSTCKVCGSSLVDAIDQKTNKSVQQELSSALSGDAELIGHTIKTWSTSRLDLLTKGLPEELTLELKRELPAAPVDLLTKAATEELFATDPFKGVLANLKDTTARLVEQIFKPLPEYKPRIAEPLPANIAEDAKNLAIALAKLDKAISFGNWQKTNLAVARDAVMAIIKKNDPTKAPINDASPLGVKLASLLETIKSAAPVNAALEQTKRMQTALKTRRERENRLSEYEAASSAITDVIQVGTLAQTQVESLRKNLDKRATYWRNKIYNNAYSTSGYGLVGSDMDSKGAFELFVGSNGVSAPAQHISNASALRASLVGFYLAFWEHVQKERGGLRLMILDDPQELLDDDNRDRLARTLPTITDAGAQIILTTHNRTFARMSVAEARKKDLIEHRSVHPVNSSRATAHTAPAIEELDLKRIAFENNVDDASKAQDYATEARAFIEQRLSDLFDDPAYPAYSTTSKDPSFTALIDRLRGLVGNAPNELFRRKVIIDFSSEPALKQGGDCLALLNKSHHKDKSKITYKDVFDQAANLKRLRTSIESVHEEFRRWRWRDPKEAASEIVPLKPAKFPSFSVDIHPDLAAFTAHSLKASSQETETEKFESSWLNSKSFYYLKNENMGFAAPAASIVVVECEPKPGNDRNLVIARHKKEILARRLLRPQNDAILVALAAQTPDPTKSPPTRMIDPGEVQIHRVLGVLFDKLPPPVGRYEAVLIDEVPALKRIETSYRVRDESALPLALPGQIVLGGKSILPTELGSYEGQFVALTLMDGVSIFKRVGAALPGLPSLRQFESIGGLGASEVVAIELLDDDQTQLRVMESAREILGVIYE